MSEKRKDDKKRNLRDGESQRKDGRYCFRYSVNGTRRCVYALTLDELRGKEAEIWRNLDSGIDEQADKLTVLELVEEYLMQRQGARQQTKQAHRFACNVIKKHDISRKLITTIRPSYAKAFLISLHDGGMKYKSISIVKSVLSLSYDMAINDGIIRKNPFGFKLSEIIENDTKTRKPLTKEEVTKLFDYLLSSKARARYYDELMILLKTGLRISELYGLTMDDVDFKNRRIRINKQIQVATGGKYYIEKPKTQSGERFVPMVDDEVYQSFQNVFEKRKTQKETKVIDGYEGFLFLAKTGRPKTSKGMEVALRKIIASYNKTHDDALPNITPHTFRHTFCTEMALSNVNIKALQYVMGHSSVSTTLDIYTSMNFDFAKDELTRAAQRK